MAAFYLVFLYLLVRVNKNNNTNIAVTKIKINFVEKTNESNKFIYLYPIISCLLSFSHGRLQECSWWWRKVVSMVTNGQHLVLLIRSIFIKIVPMIIILLKLKFLTSGCLYY